MKEFIRGEIIQFFDWQFRDKDKDVTIPEAASLRVAFPGCRQPREIDLVRDGTSWSAEWDSSESGPGTVYFFVESTNPKVAVAQGQFRLNANPANPRGE